MVLFRWIMQCATPQTQTQTHTNAVNWIGAWGCQVPTRGRLPPSQPDLVPCSPNLADYQQNFLFNEHGPLCWRRSASELIQCVITWQLSTLKASVASRGWRSTRDQLSKSLVLNSLELAIHMSQIQNSWCERVRSFVWGQRWGSSHGSFILNIPGGCFAVWIDESGYTRCTNTVHAILQANGFLSCCSHKFLFCSN